jgi:hypothetical protein
VICLRTISAGGSSATPRTLSRSLSETLARPLSPARPEKNLVAIFDAILRSACPQKSYSRKRMRQMNPRHAAQNIQVRPRRARCSAGSALSCGGCRLNAMKGDGAPQLLCGPGAHQFIIPLIHVDAIAVLIVAVLFRHVW